MSENKKPCISIKSGDNSIGALWLNESESGKKYLSGNFKGEKVTIFIDENVIKFNSDSGINIGDLPF